ncbi:hypothetical protein AXG93_2884s1220 [Marchantia polymorpha subsp. ruderalis]|uniref:Anaphase-promoting complex subunit 4 WD40 domain-containing protein n=1 Tax=Marchantia polymorpha subsp. ruderalis TaxID=1480154 RepID=A0A176WL34_MARPO|nr:hypothetical protein AXG93_2884s1220 [Marchantia polymorpha subsp. ruderalis]
MAAPRLSMSSAPQSVKASGSEAYYKSNLDLVLKENKQLKQRLDQLEKENRGLKKAVYDLSVRHSACNVHLGKVARPFDIDNLITPESSPPEELDDVVRVPDLGPQKVGLQVVPSSKSNRKADRRQFYHKSDLKGHTGSVYAAQFSKTNNLLASGSFDQSVRVWDVQNSREVLCFQEHLLNVSDVCWSNDGTVLLSGGFDHCVKEWDVVAGKALHSYSELQGFIQAVRFNPADNDVFLAGSTSKQVYVLDRRVKSTGAIVMHLSTDAKVSALILYRNGIACMSAHGDDGVHVAVNSYDNVLRVYDKFSVIEQPQMRLGGLRIVHAINGTRTKNWPIKSTLFQGHDYSQSARKRWPREDDGLTTNGDYRLRSTDLQSSEDLNVQNSLLLATGSADNCAYIYDVSGPSGTAELVQQLDGHNDRVCGAIFHPQDPVLATYSADFTLKLWKPRPHQVTDLS